MEMGGDASTCDMFLGALSNHHLLSFLLVSHRDAFDSIHVRQKGMLGLHETLTLIENGLQLWKTCAPFYRQ